MKPKILKIGKVTVSENSILMSEFIMDGDNASFYPDGVKVMMQYAIKELKKEIKKLK